jgi:hypothetical protein
MDEDKREARRRLLAQIKNPEDALKVDAPAPAPASPPMAMTPPSPSVEELDAGWKTAKPPLVMTPPVPSVEELDGGWDDEEEEEPEEPEAALPDQRLEPERYAEALQAREERARARAERKARKAREKKERRRARADAASAKQKTKTKSKTKKRPPPPGAEDAEPEVAEAPDHTQGREHQPRTVQHPRTGWRAALGGTNARMLAIAVAIFLAAAAIVAATMR